MLFNAKDAISQAMAETITRAVLAADAFARVRVDAPNRQIHVDGQLTAAQAAAALDNAGCDARMAAVGHVPGGSTCCGGCT